MADTLEELMTDEATDPDDPYIYSPSERNILRAQLRPGYRALREKAERLDALEADPKSFYAAIIRSYESRARALRESHDALREAVKTANALASDVRYLADRIERNPVDATKAFMTLAYRLESATDAALAKAEALHG